MRRRLYFLMRDVNGTREAVDALLLARIEARHMHILARPGIDLDGLPEATLLEKTDLVHGAQTGLVAGALVGVGVGAFLLLFPISPAQPGLGTILIASLLGALFGAWVASLAGSAIPNSRLVNFERRIERGRVLLMVDVPFRRVSEVRGLLERLHPDAISGGVEPTIPAFP